MKTLIAALSLVTLIAAPTFTRSATAAPNARRDANYNGEYYNQNGTVYYHGYPLRDWEGMHDGW